MIINLNNSQIMVKLLITYLLNKLNNQTDLKQIKNNRHSVINHSQNLQESYLLKTLKNRIL